MLKSFFWQQRVVVSCLAFMCLFSSFVASAQSYTINPGNGTCITHVQGGTSPTYTFTASGSGGGPSYSWSVRGDLAIVSQTAFSVQVRSTGYGKGRLTYNFGLTPCDAFRTSVDLYKTFTSPDPIVGPSCLRPGEKVTYSIKPIITTPTQIAQEIGVDTYTWKINGVTSDEFSSPWPFSYASGDKSSITITAPANLSGNTTLSVIVGSKCNGGTPKTFTIVTKASIPSFAGTIPSCIATSSSAPFTLSVTAQPGVTYAWSKTLGGAWTVSAPTVANGLNTVTITPDAGVNATAAEITVVANNTGCESAVNKILITRQLTAGINAINGGLGCLVVNTPVAFSLQNPPANSTFTWTAPAGWTPATATGTSASFTPTATAQPGSITVKTSTCSAGISMTPIVSNNQGLAFSISNLDCGLFRVNAANFVRTGATYNWYLGGVYKGTTSGSTNSFTFDSWTGAQTISVVITKAAPDCLNASASLANVTYGGCFRGRMGNIENADASLQSSVEVFPNPAENQVTLKLPNNDQVKEIALTDITGKEIKRFNTIQSSHDLNVTTLPAGTYVLKVKVGKSLVIKKIVLVK